MNKTENKTKTSLFKQLFTWEKKHVYDWKISFSNCILQTNLEPNFKKGDKINFIELWTDIATMFLYDNMFSYKDAYSYDLTLKAKKRNLQV